MSLVEADYVWLDGNVIPWKEAKVPILTHGLHYGTGVFEGIRAYTTGDNVCIFRLRDHLKRFVNSAKVIDFRTPYTLEDFFKASVELIRLNNIRESAYIRPIIFVGYGGTGIGIDFTPFPIHAAIYTIPFKHYFSVQILRVCVSSWRRIPESSLPPGAKACGNYLNSVLAKMEARRNGYDEAILLDQRGYVSEGSGENIFIVRDGEVATPPPSSSILEGITRDSVIKIAPHMGIKVVEREITRTELYTCDEAFFTGTAAEVTPIIEVDARPIAGGEVGEITSKIRSAYLDVVRGKVPEFSHWLTKVYQSTAE